MNPKKQTELLENLAWISEKITQPAPELPSKLSSEILIQKVNCEQKKPSKIPYFFNFSKPISAVFAVIVATVLIFSPQLNRNYPKQNLQFATIPAMQTLRLNTEENDEISNKLSAVSPENVFILSEFGDVYLIIGNEYKFIAVLCREFKISEDKTLKIIDPSSDKFLEFDIKTLEPIK